MDKQTLEKVSDNFEKQALYAQKNGAEWLQENEVSERLYMYLHSEEHQVDLIHNADKEKTQTHEHWQTQRRFGGAAHLPPQMQPAPDGGAEQEKQQWEPPVQFISPWKVDKLYDEQAVPKLQKHTGKDPSNPNLPLCYHRPARTPRSSRDAEVEMKLFPHFNSKTGFDPSVSL